MKSIFILLFAALCSLTTYAQHTDAPQKAKIAFEKAYNGATKVKWDKEGDQYEASFLYQGKKMSVVYTADGNVTETETAIAIADLPKSAQEYAQRKGKIKDAARIVKADGSVIYEAEVNGKDLLFNDKGNFISENKD